MARTAKNARNFTQCDSLLLGGKCSAQTYPYIENKNNSSKIEHEASTSKISDEQLFYLRSRGISEEDAINLIVNGFFVKKSFRNYRWNSRLKRKKLLGISLEGAVG